MGWFQWTRLKNSDLDISQYVFKTTYPISFISNFSISINSVEYFNGQFGTLVFFNSRDEDAIGHNRSTDIWFSRMYLKYDSSTFMTSLNGETNVIAVGI